ncbi:RAI16 PROTEIN-RELATED [Ceraceosorus bombacis]|uniref:RAI16 PROTEIN-RELATED n=1 Tax=Ceraceosorus bombacis TaxID=401625 RepID=A0A0P1BGW4_9BASI|nr:RAI16 PROTEIN-RELATED [Ceraceosorus bombacis]
MDLISRLRRSSSRQNVASSSADPLQPLKSNWESLRSTLQQPDQAVLHHGVSRSDIPKRMRRLADDLVTQGDTGEGESAEGLAWALDEDVFATLLRLTSSDKPPGVLVHVIELFSRLTVELPAPFLASPGVHGPLARLLRVCTGDAERKAALGGSDSDETFSVDSLEEEENEDADVSVAVRPGSAEEHALVELLCRIASRLRNTPELLPVFFREAHTKIHASSSDASEVQADDAGARPASPAGSSASTATVRAGPTEPLSDAADSSAERTNPTTEEGRRSSTPPKAKAVYDFALLTHLLRFAHRESKTGELARSGLYFLFTRAFAPTHNLRRGRRGTTTSATGRDPRHEGEDTILLEAERTTSRALANHLVESDFADVLGAGLGAVYGLLPPRILIKRQRAAGQPGKGPSMLGGGMSLGDGVLHDETTLGEEDDLGLVDSSAPEVQTQLRVLVDLTEFIQLVMRTAQTAASSSISDPELASAAAALTSRLAESIRKSFLRNILNPSLLECSDADNSSVAVMCYLDVLLQAIDDESPLADVVVGWLVGDELDTDDTNQQAGVSTSRRGSQQETISLSPDTAKKRKHARRRSVALHEIQQQHGAREAKHFTGEGRYDLRDLILDHIGQGKGAATTTAALRLASTLLGKHGRFAIEGFLTARPDEQATAFPFPFIPNEPDAPESGTPDEDGDEQFVYPGALPTDENAGVRGQISVPGLTLAQHVQEIDILFSLVSSIEQGNSKAPKSGDSLWNAGYEHYLRDAEDALFRQSTYQDGMRLLESGSEDPVVTPPSQRLRRSSSQRSLGRSPSSRRLHIAGLASGGTSTCAPFPHKLEARDRVLTSLLRSLQRFFAHSPEENVALTGVLSALALCPYRSLEGWLVFDRAAAVSGGHAVPKTRGSADSTALEVDGDDSSDEEEEDETAGVASFWGLEPDWKQKRNGLSSSAGAPARVTVPIVVGILRSLASQIWRYRAEVPGFDRLLDERRRGLTFVENLNDALGLESIASELVDEKFSPAPPTLSAPGTIESKRLQALWDHLGVQLEIEEQQESVALPLPPSATASDGFPEEVAGPLAHRSGKPKEAEPSVQSDGDVGAAEGAKKESSFARWFGRRASKASSATTKSVVDIPTQNVVAAPPVQPFAQHYAHTTAVRVSARLSRIPAAGEWSDSVRAAEEAERQRQQMIDLLNAPAKPTKRTRFARIPSHVDGDSDAEPSNDSLRSPKSPSSETDGYYLPGADDDDDPNAIKATSLNVTTKLDGPTLSDVLDNVVILEESIKELVAIIQVRRGLGIDSLNFVP